MLKGYILFCVCVCQRERDAGSFCVQIQINSVWVDFLQNPDAEQCLARGGWYIEANKK